VVLLAVVGTIMMTGFFTLGAVVYNLISDLVGGVEVVVLEETALPHATARPRIPLPAVQRTPLEDKDKKERRVSLPNVKPMRRRAKPEPPPAIPAPPERKTGT
jgi:hypothetical protein